MRPTSILIVDSDAQIRQDLKVLVVRLGCTVAGEADSGGQALTLCRSLHPDVVLVNLLLSTSPGTTLLQTLTAERLAAIVIFATDLPPDDGNGWCANGAMGFVSLPFRENDLRGVIPLALARFRERLALEEELKNLGEKMEARKLIGRAKAILMERHQLSERDAFKRIQSQSIALNKPAHEIAQAIITASEIAAAPEKNKPVAAERNGHMERTTPVAVLLK